MSELLHVVRYGDHVARLAWEYGVAKNLILEHSQNQGLWDKGRTATMLCPGDVLYIPERDGEAVDVSLGGDNRYTARREKMFVRVRLVVDGEVWRNGKYAYLRDADPEATDASTDGEGVAAIEVDAATREVHLLAGKDLVRILVGALAPPGERLGATQRLSNMGYVRSLASPDPQTRERMDRAAPRVGLARFQHEHKSDAGLDVTGGPDEKTCEAVASRQGSASHPEQASVAGGCDLS